MSNFSKKFVSVALTLAMAGMLVASVPAAKAQSSADLQAQISLLLAQIAQLQAQLNGQASTGTCTQFTRNLTVGSTGSDVKDLQVFLNSHGYVVSTSGAGSVGLESTYFGSKTTAALAKFQAANSISPAVGYFGPLTRAKVNSMCSPVVIPPGTTPPPVPGAGVSVRLSPMNPSSGSLISSASSAAARVNVLSVEFTAGSASGITVSDLSFVKNGVLSDSSISGAYLVESGKVVAQYNSITSGKINFSNLGWNIAAGQTKTLWLAIDPASGLSAGNTVSFSLASASDVKAWDANNAASNVSGSFPMSGNLFTVTSVSNPSLATLTVASTSIGTEVTAGTSDNVVGGWNFTISNSKVWLKSINFRVVGSANKSDIRSVRLFVRGVQVGQPLTAVAADGSAYFDLSATPAELGTGTNEIQVHADIAGSPSYRFQFEILNSYDIYAVDSQYNVPISTQANVGTEVLIKTGSVTVNRASDTPTGNIAPGQSNVTLAKFTVYAAGEALRIKWLGVGLNITGMTTSIDNHIRNLALMDDAGGQVGSTINTLSTTVTCTDTAFSNSTTSYRTCYGNSSSPINYQVPANTTRTLSLKADIQSAASFTTVAGLLTGNTSNAQGITSSQPVSTGGATASALAFSSTQLTVARNSAVGTQTFAAGATQVKVGSYTLTASSAEGVKVNNINITSGTATTTLQNMYVMVNGTQFGSTQSIVSPSIAYTFNGTPFTIPQGQSVTVDVYSDIQTASTAATYTALTTLSGCSASGANSLNSISCTSTSGQSVTVAGQATLTVSATDVNAKQLVMGSHDNTLATFRFQETSNVEEVKINNLVIFDQVATTGTVKSAFNNVRLYDTSGNILATAGSANTSVATSTPGFGYYYRFSFSSPVIVPKNTPSVSLVLKGDVSSFSENGATDVSTHIFKIATSSDTQNDTAVETVEAYGRTSNATTSITLSSATGGTLTILRSKLSITSQALGSTSARARTATDPIAQLTLSADAAGDVLVNTITFTFSGGANTSTVPSSATLVKHSDGTTFASATVVATTTTSVTFSLSGSDAQISSGSPAQVDLRINSNNTNAVSQQTDSLTVQINAVTDVSYTTAPSGGTSGVNMQSGFAPFTVVALSYE